MPFTLASWFWSQKYYNFPSWFISGAMLNWMVLANIKEGYNENLRSSVISKSVRKCTQLAPVLRNISHKRIIQISYFFWFQRIYDISTAAYNSYISLCTFYTLFTYSVYSISTYFENVDEIYKFVQGIYCSSINLEIEFWCLAMLYAKIKRQSTIWPTEPNRPFTWKKSLYMCIIYICVFFLFQTTLSWMCVPLRMAMCSMGFSWRPSSLLNVINTWRVFPNL